MVSGSVAAYGLQVYIYIYKKINRMNTTNKYNINDIIYCQYV